MSGTFSKDVALGQYGPAPDTISDQYRIEQNPPGFASPSFGDSFDVSFSSTPLPLLLPSGLPPGDLFGEQQLAPASTTQLQAGAQTPQAIVNTGYPPLFETGLFESLRETPSLLLLFASTALLPGNEEKVSRMALKQTAEHHQVLSASEAAEKSRPNIVEVAQQINGRFVPGLRKLDGATHDKYTFDHQAQTFVFDPKPSSLPHETAAVYLAQRLGYGHHLAMPAAVEIEGRFDGRTQTKKGMIREFFSGQSYEALGIGSQSVSVEARLFDLVIGDWDRTLNENLGNLVLESGTDTEKWVDFNLAWRTDNLKDMLSFRSKHFKETAYVENLMQDPNGKVFMERLRDLSPAEFSSLLASANLKEKQIRQALQRREHLLKIFDSLQ